jgi:cytochrome c nitrite reductase small subunit
MMRLLRHLLTLAWVPAVWRLPVWIGLGVFAGLGVTTIHVSRALSYMSDAPETCMNCHVMTQAYETWNHSSHRNVAVCNDCHVPHTSLVETYAFKAEDGLRHSKVFTLRQEPQVIQLSAGAIPVVQENCLRCHQALVGDIHLRAWKPGDNRCWDCHREVPHSRVHSLSSSHDVMAPKLPEVFADPRRMQSGGRDPRPVQPSDPQTPKEAAHE